MHESSNRQKSVSHNELEWMYDGLNLSVIGEKGASSQAGPSVRR